MSMLKKAVLATTLAASALVSTATPVMARDYYGSRDNTAAVAIGVGIIGLAIGAIAASSNNDNRGYRDDRYYDRRVGSYDDRSYRGDYYNRSRGYDRDERRYDRNGSNDRYYSRRGY